MKCPPSQWQNEAFLWDTNNSKILVVTFAIRRYRFIMFHPSTRSCSTVPLKGPTFAKGPKSASWHFGCLAARFWMAGRRGVQWEFHRDILALPVAERSVVKEGNYVAVTKSRVWKMHENANIWMSRSRILHLFLLICLRKEILRSKPPRRISCVVLGKHSRNMGHG